MRNEYKRKQHEVYFYEKIKNNKLLPFFEKVFKWGNKSKNDIQLEDGFNAEYSNEYCKYYGEQKVMYKQELEKAEIKIVDNGTLQHESHIKSVEAT